MLEELKLKEGSRSIPLQKLGAEKLEAQYQQHF